MTIRVEPLTGARLQAALPDLARLRMTVFREWPYLYNGSADYEQGYLAKFSRDPDAVIVAAFDGESIVGIATAAPMTGHAEAFAAPFRDQGFDIARIFYFGESVLLPRYRGQGLGHAFFDAREAHARRFGTFTHATFCAVVRADDHPMRPADYRPLDGFWRKRGYVPLDGVVAQFDWQDIGETGETFKPMQFWIRALPAAGTAVGPPGST